MAERIQIVELDLDRCSNTYGVAPCTASVPATGEQKCFNCLASCQDRPNYNSETVTVRYCTATGRNMPPEIELIPYLKSVSQRPAKLELGESIGIRASIDLTFSDSRSPDTGPDGDYYLSDRDYDPYQQGTYWGKFRARYPFLKGSDIRVLQGTTDQTLEQMEVRHFMFDTMAGPDSGGTFTIKCKDALQLASGKQAQAPRLSNGSLSADITAGATSVTLSPSGVGSEYPSSGTAQIGGKEVVTFARSGDTFTITRAQSNTEAVEHKQDDRFQLCLVYSGERSVNIIKDLFEEYANVPSSYIPFADWTSEWQNYINRLYSAVIAEPTPVNDLVNELLQQTASALWWDDSARLLRFRVLRAVSDTASIYTDDLIKAGSFSVKDQPDKRVSQVWTFYGQLNPLEKLDDSSNYANSLATVAPQSEQDYGSPAIKRIFSRWIPRAGGDAASRLNDLILSRYTQPPRLFTWGLQRSDLLVEPSLGGGYRLENRGVQSFDGSTDIRPVQVIQVKTTDTGHAVLAEEVLYSETISPVDPTIKEVPIDNSQNNVNLYSEATGLYEIDTGDTINCEIASSVVIGSSSTSQPAFTTGSGWPSGVTINIINRGRIEGAGGKGGDGGDSVASSKNPIGRDGASGEDGGLGISFLYNCSFTNDGFVAGGGGGGGGGGGATHNESDNFEIKQATGGGGAGAQGNIGGGAGLAGEFFQGTISGELPGPADTAITGSGTDGTAGSRGGEGVRGNGAQAGNIQSGRGGSAGSFGQNGQSGTDGTGPDDSAYDYGFGGPGGSAGPAIDKNGNTVTYTDNGTTLGSIIP